MPAPLPPSPQPDDPAAPFLFPNDAIEEITNEELKHGRYTLARLPKNKLNNIIQLLGENRKIREVERILNVAWETVKEVLDHPEYGAEIERRRGIDNAVTARKFRRCTLVQLDRAERYPEVIPPASIALATKLWTEMAELLEGKATSRVEHTTRVDIFADYKSFLAELESEYEQKNGAAIGCAAGKIPQIKNAPPAADPGPTIEVDLEVATDQQSEDLAQSSQVDSGIVPSSVPTEAKKSQRIEAVDPQGGRSSSAAPGGPATDNPPQNFWPYGSFKSEVEE
jgi:predicted Zn-ribbon and HTH transcriptional regulator